MNAPTPGRRWASRRNRQLAVVLVLLAVAVGIYQVLVFGLYRQNQPATDDGPSIASDASVWPVGQLQPVGARDLAAPTDGRIEPRTIIALYNSATSPLVRDTTLHRAAEMPLNHLGLILEYADLAAGLPDLTGRTDVRGVLAWINNEDVADPHAYYVWADGALRSGLRYVAMGDVIRDQGAPTDTRTEANAFYRQLGVRLTDAYVAPTYDVAVVDQDREIADFERGFDGPLPPFDRFVAIDPAVATHLTLRQGDGPDADSHPIVSGPKGGVVAAGYALTEARGTDQLRWRINPFTFFARVFATDTLPKPDVTTLSGRRIYYSHIDGDGWLSLSTVDRYRDQGVIAADVIHNNAIAPYPDLPVTVAPIAADLDRRWVGTEEARRVARALFLLPQVEAGSHTYSHPFDWEWFDGYQAVAEQPFLRKYFPEGSGGSLVRDLFGRNEVGYDEVAARYAAEVPAAGDDLQPLENVYTTPRAYAHFPYDLTTEISGAADLINSLLPPGKRVEVVQWTGNTSPYEAVLTATREAGMRNLNGGDSRFDPRFPSHTSVPPVGRRVGNEQQIYASNSNENTYTALWTDRFYGFQQLKKTLDNTDSPIRLKPFNIYYHMYSGEKQPALEALLSNLDYARASELTPITTSEYAAIGDGFFSTRIVDLGDRRWRIEDRDGLQTIRFDDADDLAVDFSRSTGIVGQRHSQGVLYVALDHAVAAPVIALQAAFADSQSASNHLVHSRWTITWLRHDESGFSFLTRGFGAGEMSWQVTANGAYTIVAQAEGREVFRTTEFADSDGVLNFTIDAAGIDPLSVRVMRSPQQEG